MRRAIAFIFVLMLGVLGPWGWRASLAPAACDGPAQAACTCCAPVIETPTDACCGTDARETPVPPAMLALASCPTCRCGPAPNHAPSHTGHQLSPDAPSRAPAPDAVCLIDLSPRPAAKSDGPAMVAPLDAHTRRALLNVRTT